MKIQSDEYSCIVSVADPFTYTPSEIYKVIPLGHAPSGVIHLAIFFVFTNTELHLDYANKIVLNNHCNLYHILNIKNKICGYLYATSNMSTIYTESTILIGRKFGEFSLYPYTGDKTLVYTFKDTIGNLFINIGHTDNEFAVKDV